MEISNKLIAIIAIIAIIISVTSTYLVIDKVNNAPAVGSSNAGYLGVNVIRPQSGMIGVNVVNSEEGEGTE